MDFIILGILLIVLTLQVVTLLVNKRVSRQKDNEYYTDYSHKRLVLRVFKPEFEYQALEGIPRDKLLDRGTLSQFYVWILFEK